MNNDKNINITVGQSRKSTHWHTQEMLWSEFCLKTNVPTKTSETYAEYMKLCKAQQDELKDVGGFVGGRLSGQRRKAENVQSRDLVTLDADNIPPGDTQKIVNLVDTLGCAYVIYSTRKHCGAKPRLRIIFPLDRSCTADEYEPIARKLASMLDINIFDPTTFEVCRLMYWPSTSSDGEFVHTVAYKGFVSTDGILQMYDDWRNFACWPQIPGAGQIQIRAAKKQGDPLEKSGVVGAFCRTYSVDAAIEKFLSGLYIPTNDGRYTYVGGSTVGGAVVYDNGNFLYSHHATDPCSGRLVNAFDLIRLHMFEQHDDTAKVDTPTAQLPSYKEMQELAVSDSAVSSLLNSERYERLSTAFGNSCVGEQNTNWMEALEIHSKTGKPLRTTDNVLLIMEHDPNLKGVIYHDELSNRPMLQRDLPWRTLGTQNCWNDTDSAGLRHYLEKIYDITGKERINDGFSLAALKCARHEIKEYLNSLQWDGVKRLDSLLIDYFGAEDSLYTRDVTRKALTAAVARVMAPGIKFDNMLVLTGLQGVGKSTFFKVLGGKWHNDSITEFKGKEAAEIIQGYWIIELGELTAMNRSEVNDVKQFMSRQEDVYREAYGRHTKPYPRQCVFFGTTNDDSYLRDHTGGRRFWPIDLGVVNPRKNVFCDLKMERDQVWAEAALCWTLGEKLYLTGEAQKLAKLQQEGHREVSPKEGVIKEFISRRVPPNWLKRSITDRRVYWNSKFDSDNNAVERDRICAAEVWCECLNGDIKQMQRRDALEINNIMTMIEGWERDKIPIRYGATYGNQRGFHKKG